MHARATSGQDLDRWHASGWFGALFGGTLWLAIGAATALQENEPIAGGVALGAFLAANAIGIVLWCRRSERNAYRSLQTLIWVLAVLASVTIVTFDRTGACLELGGLARTTRFQMYAVLLVFPILSVMFHLRHRTARRST